MQTRLIHIILRWLIVSALFLATPVCAMDTLRVLAWPGYADPDVVRAFEQRYQAHVEVTFVGADEVLWQQMHAEHGQLFDVVAANSAEMQRYTREGLLAPLELSALPNTRKQLPRFQARASIPGLIHDGRVYAIPYTYSTMGLIYDRRQFSQAPQSMNAMWDPRFRQKVLDFNSAEHNFSFTALTLGIRAPFNLSPAQRARAAQRLIALRRNVLTYYNQPEEATELFVHHKVALMFGNYGTQQLSLLRRAGADVGYVIPKEGALAWLDCWAMTRAARNRVLAQNWINYMLDPWVSGLLTQRQGLANTLTASTDLTPNAKIIWLEPVVDTAEREALWQKIISGDRPRSF